MSKALLEAALEYAALGYQVFPLHHPIEDGNGGLKCSCGKDCQHPAKHPRYYKEDLPNGHLSATTDEKQIRAWWARWPQANIGIRATGDSGLAVMDTDPRNGGAASFKRLQALGNLPVTPEQGTGGGGWQHFFEHPGEDLKDEIPGYLGIDIKANGYVVAPPSRHISGEHYFWKYHPKNVKLASFPDWLLELVKKNGAGPKRTTAQPVGETIPAGQRNNTLASLAGSMRRRGMTQEAIEAALLVENQRCVPPLPDADVLRIARSISRYEPGAAPSPAGQAEGTPAPEPITGGFNQTDMGNAARLVALHGRDLHYCDDWGKWLVWNDQKWVIDNTGAIKRLAKDTVRRIYQEASRIADNDERKALAKWALKCESERLRSNMIMAAQCELAIVPDDIDRDPWLLNVENGTINLKTGELLPHRREDLITKLALVQYDPQAQYPVFWKFLNRIFNRNLNLITFLQRAMGYSLTGLTIEQVFFILWGLGDNGKSTLLNILKTLLGDYAKTTSTETFLTKKYSSIPNDIAALKGARLVTAIETGLGRRMAENLVKEVTGGDPISARFMRAEWFTFNPEFKLFLATNHKPVVKDTTHAMWRRIHLIKFTEQIPKKERDGKLPEKLKTELPGILNWALEGCLNWQDFGLDPPSEVQAATQEYREEMDLLGDWLKECCIVDTGASALARELYESYTKWAEGNGEKRPLSQRAFGGSLTERKFERKPGTGNKIVWWGIGLNPS